MVRLADKCGIDLPAVADSKIRKNQAKYPASLVRGSAKKYNEYGAAEVALAASQAAAEEEAASRPQEAQAASNTTVGHETCDS